MTTAPVPWALAIDFGTSFTVAAIRVGDRAPETLEIFGERRVPSVVLVDDDANGTLRVGRVAEDLSSTRPGSVVRAPKRRVGDPVPIVIGGRPFGVVDVVGALLRHVVDEAIVHQGSPPTRVILTHPAMWSRPRLDRLVEAAAKAGLTNVALLAEPVAAAIAYAAEVGVADGATVAVYDLGGGTFDTTVLRAEGRTFRVVGDPSGDANIGGELFDELVVNFIGAQIDPALWENLQASDDMMWRQAATALRAQARRAKESLSTSTTAELLLPLPTGMLQVALTREQLNDVIRPYIEESVRVLLLTVRRAGVDPGTLSAVFLVGGSSRMPIVEELLSQALPGVTISRRSDPKTAVALGATQANPAAEPTAHATTSPTFVDPITEPERTPPAVAPIIAAPPPPAPPASAPIAPATVLASAENATVVAGATALAAPAAPLPLAPSSPSSVPPAPPIFAPRGSAAGKRNGVIAGIAAAVVVGILAVVLATRGGDANTTTPATPTTRQASTLAATSAAPQPSTTTPVTTVSTNPLPTSPPSTARPPQALKAGRGPAVLLNLGEVANATALLGWSSTPFTPGPDLCGLSAPDATEDYHAVALRQEAVGQGVAVHSAASTYASVADVNRNFDVLRQAVTACPNPTSVEGGTTYTLSFTDLSEGVVPGVERSMSFGLVAAGGGQVVGNVLTFASIGRSVMLLQYQIFNRAPDDGDTARATSLVNALVEKFIAEIA